MKIKLITDTPQFDDLVKNMNLFHEKYDPTDLANLPTWIDHSDYDNYPHINYLLSTLTEDDIAPKTKKSWIALCPISYIRSSDESKGGYDRPIWTSTHGDSKCRESLNVKTEDGNLKGFNPEDAGTLTVYLRPCGSDSDGNRLYQLVKCIGNNRVWMKLLANRGKDSEVKVEIFFHTEGEYSDWLKKESDVHSTDATARSGQNEKQKFISSYRAGRPDAVYCFDFLRRMKLEYGSIMDLEGHIDNPKDWLTITSLQGIKEGDGNGYFNKYTEECVIEAVKITKQIASEITKETTVGSGTIKCFSQLYRIFTLYGLEKDSKEKEPIFTKKELSDFFIAFYEYKNPKSSNAFGSSATFELKNLSVSGGVKDTTYINVMTFWPEIVGYYKNINNKTNGFSFGSPAIIQLLDNCNDRFLLGPIKVKLAA